MGNYLCPAKLEQQKIQEGYGTFPEGKDTEYRKGEISKKVGIRLEEIYDRLDTETIKKINKLVFKVSQFDKKFKEPIRIVQKPIARNKLPDKYYLVSLQSLYVGQWIFDSEFQENVPGGIGRLYQINSIQQGNFKSFPIDGNKKKKEDEGEDQNERDVIEQQEQEDQNEADDEEQQIQKQKQKQASKKVESKKIEKLIKEDRKKILNELKFQIKLEGTGRVLELDDKNEVYMEGEFQDGILNGMGTIRSVKITEQVEKKSAGKRFSSSLSLTSSQKKIDLNDSISKDSTGKKQKKVVRKEIYKFKGEWKKGLKNGKGQQQVHVTFCQATTQNQIDFDDENQQKSGRKKQIGSQNFYYKGVYANNQRQGKGQLIYLGSAKTENKIKKDIQKFDKKLSAEPEQIANQINKKRRLRYFQEHFIDFFLKNVKNTYKYLDKPMILEEILLFQYDFLLDRTYRTIFSEKYIGEFSQNYMQGQGIYVWPNGKTYKGQWKQNLMHGFGQFYWPDGSYFQGYYQNDEKHGFGIMTWSPEKRYRGDWAFGMRHGYGQSIEINRATKKLEIKSAIWDRDKIKKHLKSQQIDIEDNYEKLAKAMDTSEENRDILLKEIFSGFMSPIAKIIKRAP